MYVIMKMECSLMFNVPLIHIRPKWTPYLPLFVGHTFFLCHPFLTVSLSLVEKVCRRVCSCSFFSSGTQWTLMHTLCVLRIRRASENAACQISAMGNSSLQHVIISYHPVIQSQQRQRIMCCICTIAPFACDYDKHIPNQMSDKEVSVVSLKGSSVFTLLGHHK